MSTDSFVHCLPVGWDEEELGVIAETQLGKMLNSSKQTGSAKMPYLRNINLQWGRISLTDVKEMDIFDDEKEQFTLSKGDVLVCEGGEPGRSAVWNNDLPMAFQNAIHRIRPSSRINSEFLCYQFEWLTLNGFLDENFTGVTIKHFSQQKLRRIKCVVPSLQEQEKIVEILEEQLSRLDAALAAVRAVREKSARFRRSLLKSAFNGALTGHDPAAGVLPNDWHCSRLDEVAKVQLGRQRSPKHHAGPNMRPYLRAANVTWKGLDVSDVSEMNFTDEEMETYRLKDGDILVNEASGSASEVGKAVVFRGEIEDCGFQNHLIRVRVTSVNPSYLYQFLVKNAVLGEYLRESQGVGINHLGKTKLASWPVPVPSLEEQVRIVEILEEQLLRLDASLEIADVIEKKALAFRQSLLHAAFSGNLTKEWREGADV